MDPDACLKLGLDARKHFRILKGGESVTLDDGRVVTPDMVLGA
jgi:hypothetical protein